MGEACLFIAAGRALLAGGAVAPETVSPAAVWIDWPESAAHSDGWWAAVPAGAVEAGSPVTAVESAGRSDGMQVAVAVLLAATDGTAARRDAIRDVVAVLPVGTVDWLDAPGGQRDAPAEQQDGRDALQDDRDARRGDPADYREELADCPAGQAERRDGRDACRDDPDARRDDRDARQAGPDECQGDLGHPDATHREAA